MTDTSNPGSDDRLPLARATLVAFYAMVGLAADFAHAAPYWLPDLEPITVEEALRRLAALRPVVTCAPFPTGRDIAIGAWEGQPLNKFKDEVLDLMLQDIRVRTPRFSREDYKVTVRGEAEGDVADLTWPQYEQWMREFQPIAPGVTMKVVISPLDEHAPHFVVTIAPPVPEGWLTGTYL